jgi:hypothetical protein
MLTRPHESAKALEECWYLHFTAMCSREGGDFEKGTRSRCLGMTTSLGEV